MTGARSSTGLLAENVVHFARLLRAAGLSIGPGRIAEALRTIEAVGVDRRDDFYWALHAVFVSRFEDRALFDEAFQMFWRDPASSDRLLAQLLPPAEGSAAAGTRVSRRLAEAWGLARSEPRQARAAHAALTASSREVLRHKDFAQMSVEELAKARRAVERMRIALAPRSTRRLAPEARGSRIDLRGSLRAALRTGGRDLPLRWRAPRLRPPPLVVLCDISGSMERYSLTLLYFLHALVRQRSRVHCFVFGTRLTPVTRWLRHRDADVALDKLGREVPDWGGGTRLGHCLREFNRRWSRRVLAEGAVVLLVTDGLDREAGKSVAKEAERLRKSCRRVVWLNPLLRYEGFEPKAQGIQALLPWVDEQRPVHDLASLDALAAALG